MEHCRPLSENSRYVTVKLRAKTLAALDRRVTDTLASGRAEVLRQIIERALQREPSRD